MRIQAVLDSDIAMVFDECTPYRKIGDRRRPRPRPPGSMRLSLRWAQRSPATSSRRLASPRTPKHLFGIVQGGMYEAARTNRSTV